MQTQPALLLLDEDVWAGLAMALRDRGIDAISVHELGRTGLSDQEQLVFAVQEGRALLTHNIADFASFFRKGQVGSWWGGLPPELAAPIGASRLAGVRGFALFRHQPIQSRSATSFAIFSRCFGLI